MKFHVEFLEIVRVDEELVFEQVPVGKRKAAYIHGFINFLILCSAGSDQKKGGL